MDKEKDILNPCGHRDSERVKALKKLPSYSICPACLLERIKEREAEMANEKDISAKAYTACGNYQERIKELEDIYIGQMRVIARSRITYKERVVRMVALAEQALKGGK